MKIYALICTRSKDFNPITTHLVKTLKDYGVNVKLLVGQKSIFKAYEKGMKVCNPSDNDIVIMCHDDIEIKQSKEEFIAALGMCLNEKVGIIGPAGTTNLGKNAVWWDHELWRRDYHRGFIWHKKGEKEEGTRFGQYGRVAVLDGVFLAARGYIWNKLQLSMPKEFQGNWDFYDIFYTAQAHLKGFENQAAPIMLTHHSIGDTQGRDSWHINRKAFQSMFRLPISV
jgi:hypothetical protein